eukprot:COSAG01_NODE_1657_length_9590_cov_441.132336_15_plen_42_part_01
MAGRGAHHQLMTPPIEALWSRFPGAGQWFGPTAPQWAGRGRA